MVLSPGLNLAPIDVYFLEQIKRRKNRCSCQHYSRVHEVSAETDSIVHVEDVRPAFQARASMVRTDLLPQPKAISIVSLTDMLNFPSFRLRFMWRWILVLVV
jgi:hypothetical protein